LTAFHTKPLDQTTWPDFARLVEKYDGVWGGCWCMSFHLDRGFGHRTASQNRSEKEGRVREGRAHAALVYDGPQSPSAGVNSGPQTSFPASRTSALISTVSVRFRIGGLLASSLIGTTGAKASHPSPSKGLCAK
jgi:hypothetical protein